MQLPRDRDEISEAARLVLEGEPSRGGQAIVTAALVVLVGGRPMTRFFYQAVVQQPLEMAVERAGLEPHLLV